MSVGVVWTTAIAACLLVVSSRVGCAQGPDARNPARSVKSGVYTLQQANRGRDTYEAMCSSCHARASHTGPAFLRAWSGRTLWDLYAYVSESMPKNDPGTLSFEEYLQVTAYLLRLNGLPAGPAPLPAHERGLRAIRFEAAAAPRGGSARR